MKTFRLLFFLALPVFLLGASYWLGLNDYLPNGFLLVDLLYVLWSLALFVFGIGVVPARKKHRWAWAALSLLLLALSAGLYSFFLFRDFWTDYPYGLYGVGFVLGLVLMEFALEVFLAED